MAVVDLLAHALIAFALGRLLATRYDWVTPAYVTAVVAGAFVPDLTKAKLLVSSSRVEALLGIPFSWDALATGGAAAVGVLVGVAVIAPRVRGRTGLALAAGAASHLFLDALLSSPSGRSFPVFWPLTRYHPPTPGLFLSTQAWPTVAALVLAVAVALATDQPSLAPDSSGSPPASPDRSPSDAHPSGSGSDRE